MTYKYKKKFDPGEIVSATKGSADGRRGDRTEDSVYAYTEDIVLAVNVAMATQRPLLVAGPPGCGKSSLARNIAKVLEWRFYEFTVTSRTEARDLLWTVDHVQRLSDSRASQVSEEMADYLVPGVLWWAFDPESAAVRGLEAGGTPRRAAGDPGPEVNRQRENQPAVVLLDEIDKADPDFPNALLVPLGSLQFHVRELSREIQARETPLVIVTTNQQRRLSDAFLRRCVRLEIAGADAEAFERVARAHFEKSRLKTAEAIRKALVKSHEGGRLPEYPSLAEYLDIVWACVDLGVKPSQETFPQLLDVVLGSEAARERR